MNIRWLGGVAAIELISCPTRLDEFELITGVSSCNVAATRSESNSTGATLHKPASSQKSKARSAACDRMTTTRSLLASSAFIRPR